jgi:hypothetical protein
MKSCNMPYSGYFSYLLQIWFFRWRVVCGLEQERPLYKILDAMGEVCEYEMIGKHYHLIEN